MNRKILIGLIIIILIIICGSYAMSNMQKTDNLGFVNGVMQDNGTIDQHQNIWIKSSNVDLTYGEDGTHMTGKNNESCWISLTNNDTQLFINPQKDFSIEMDLKSNNMMAIYLIESIDSNGDIYLVPTITPNDFHHIKIDYTQTNQKINYFIDGNNTKSIDNNFNNTIGFKIIDWQGDMDIVIANVTVINK